MKNFLFFVFIFIGLANAYSQWQPRTLLSQGGMTCGLNENMGQCMAVNNDTIHIVYRDIRTSGSAIYYTRSEDAGTTWANPVALTDTAGKAGFPAVAVSGNFVHVVWLDTLNGVRASYYRRSPDGGNTWDQQVCVDTNTLFWPGVATMDSLVIITLNKGTFGVNTEVYITRSTDNGLTWDNEIQISNANGRSEDQAIAIHLSAVHMTWNDNRTGTMCIEYRNSYDGGVTWGNETGLTTTASYTTMVSAVDSFVDVPFGMNNGNFDVGIRQSSDTGSTFFPVQQLTFDSAAEIYPYVARSGMNLHLVYIKAGSPGGNWYLHSGDGGLTWDAPYFLDSGSQPFVAVNDCNVHVIYADSGKIYYMRNPNGNCLASGISETQSNLIAFVFPNPVRDILNIKIKNSFSAKMYLFDFTGRVVEEKEFSDFLSTSLGKYQRGIYLLKIVNKEEGIQNQKIILQSGK